MILCNRLSVSVNSSPVRYSFPRRFVLRLNDKAFCAKSRISNSTQYGNIYDMKRILQTLSTLFIQLATWVENVMGVQLSENAVQFSSSISCRIQGAAKNTPAKIAIYRKSLDVLLLNFA